ncbi:MAG: ATP-grasp domain-containing protein [Planctomycetes bacterium]|nr:ATP-grasp domain-containing protein [Planctomycetota bacterium]
MSSSRNPTRVARSKRRQLRLLFTCVGRRVELLRAFRRAGEDLGVGVEIHGADASWLSPAMHCVDKGHQVAPISSGRYIRELIEIVRKARIDLLIPLIDTELSLIADAAPALADAGCLALISSPGVVTICRDKVLTFETLTKAGIDTPATWTWPLALKKKNHKYPLFLKPRAGSAAMGNYVVRNYEELRTFGRRVKDAIVQEFVDGTEHTLDVYTGLDGRPRCAVPRKRIEVRTGEVSKALIVKDSAIMAVGKRVAQVLGDCRGVITVQCIVTPRGRIRTIEINPRFGGGVPLAIHAGADFPKWTLMELLGQKPRINPNGFRNNIAMLRYDDSVFVPRASKLK